MPLIEQLLAATAQGDQEAFSALYDEVAPRVHGLVLRVVVDGSLAEEVTQEVFLEIWRTAPRFEAQRGNAVSWLLTIAHRRAVDKVRSVSAQRRRDDVFTAASVPTPSDETADQVHALLDAQRVRSAMASLSETQRTAITLAYFEGRTQQEVAELLDIPLGTAKTRIRDGLKKLHTQLATP